MGALLRAGLCLFFTIHPLLQPRLPGHKSPAPTGPRGNSKEEREEATGGTVWPAEGSGLVHTVLKMINYNPTCKLGRRLLHESTDSGVYWQGSSPRNPGHVFLPSAGPAAGRSSQQESAAHGSLLTPHGPRVAAGYLPGLERVGLPLLSQPHSPPAPGLALRGAPVCSPRARSVAASRRPGPGPPRSDTPDLPTATGTHAAVALRLPGRSWVGRRRLARRLLPLLAF